MAELLLVLGKQTRKDNGGNSENWSKNAGGQTKRCRIIKINRNDVVSLMFGPHQLASCDRRRFSVPRAIHSFTDFFSFPSIKITALLDSLTHLNIRSSIAFNFYFCFFFFALTEMVFLCWGRPSPQEQKACIDKSSVFNYDSKYKGATAKHVSFLKEDQELSKDGFLLNHARVLVGSGLETYEKGKTALKTWRHFGLNWTFVDPKTPIQIGMKFCVCVKEFLPWVMMPLQVVYVNESKRGKKATACFGFGSGTLQGHLLAGEERFSIEMDEKNQVWYEILSFSKPANFLSFIGYPYVQLRQKYFAHQSVNAVKKYLTAS